MFPTKPAPFWEPLFNTQTNQILSDIWKRLEGQEFYPAPENVLRFAEMEGPVKVCIVGMDPYPSFNERDGIPQATGRSFEVSELLPFGWDYKIKQASLRNMVKAIYYNETGTAPAMEVLREDIASGAFPIAPPAQWFQSLEEQGVLFLNSTLTVRPGKPGTHQKLWEPFREVLIPFLEEQGATFMLWGNNAQKEIGALLTEDANVLTAPHPRMAEFVYENTFAKVSDIQWLG